eukprot:TRINITY_DN28248_c0_g2_i1.p1 TRINITY_DN28248_c0_g2~~TRINITY_DN28248_c0_g2_i1.p1  ORF type:complete len:497 (+),score=142.91 TRINITY_DN28248_c0_g2_i1:253-1743(+)
MLPGDDLRRAKLAHVFALAQVSSITGPRSDTWHDDDHAKLLRSLDAYGSEMQREAEFVKHFDRILPNGVAFFCQVVFQFMEVACNFRASSRATSPASRSSSRRQKQNARIADVVQSTVGVVSVVGLNSAKGLLVGSAPEREVAPPKHAPEEDAVVEMKLREWEKMSEEKAKSQALAKRAVRLGASAARVDDHSREDAGDTYSRQEAAKEKMKQRQREEQERDADIEQRRQAQADRRKVAEDARQAERDAREAKMRRIQVESAKKATAAAEKKAAERAERMTQERIKERSPLKGEDPTGVTVLFSPEYDMMKHEQEKRKTRSPRSQNSSPTNKGRSQSNSPVKPRLSGDHVANDRLEKFYSQISQERESSGSPNGLLSPTTNAAVGARTHLNSNRDSSRMTRSLFSSPSAENRPPTPTHTLAAPSTSSPPSTLEERMLRDREKARADKAQLMAVKNSNADKRREEKLATESKRKAQIRDLNRLATTKTSIGAPSSSF